MIDIASCLRKQDQIERELKALASPDARYHYILERARREPLLPPAERHSQDLVADCQSRLYLHLACPQGTLLITLFSDSLIALGLASLLAHVYRDEPPAALFYCPPLFLERTALPSSFSLPRRQGFAGLYRALQRRSAAWIDRPARANTS